MNVQGVAMSGLKRKQWHDYLITMCGLFCRSAFSGLTALQPRLTTHSCCTHTLSRCRSDPVHPSFPQTTLGQQQRLTSLSGLEWGPRHLGPNQSIRTNAGRATGRAPLRCVLWRAARHTAVLLKLYDRTWEVKAKWLSNHMHCRKYRKKALDFRINSNSRKDLKKSACSCANHLFLFWSFIFYNSRQIWTFWAKI